MEGEQLNEQVVEVSAEERKRNEYRRQTEKSLTDWLDKGAALLELCKLLQVDAQFVRTGTNRQGGQFVTFDVDGFINAEIEKGTFTHIPAAPVSFEATSMVILPPGEGEIKSGSGAGFEKKPDVKRTLTALALLGERQIAYNWVRGSVREDMLRQSPYNGIYIPAEKALVLICDEAGNATFIVNGVEEGEIPQYLEKNKPSLYELMPDKVKYLAYYGDLEKWKDALAKTILDKSGAEKKRVKKRTLEHREAMRRAALEKGLTLTDTQGLFLDEKGKEWLTKPRSIEEGFSAGEAPKCKNTRDGIAANNPNQVVPLYSLEELQELKEKREALPKCRDDATVTIDGEEYGLHEYFDKFFFQNQKIFTIFADLNGERKQVRSSQGHITYAYPIPKFLELTKKYGLRPRSEKGEIPELRSDLTIDIDGKLYGSLGYFRKKYGESLTYNQILYKLKIDDILKEKAWGVREIAVYEIPAAEKMLKDFIALPIVNEDGSYVDEAGETWVSYLWIKNNRRGVPANWQQKMKADKNNYRTGRHKMAGEMSIYRLVAVDSLRPPKSMTNSS